MLLADELFDPSYYLSTNSDVAAAVSRGEISSAEAHFNQFGRFEKRDPSAYLDTDYYLQQYQDVANAVNAGLTTAFTHFINSGQIPSGVNPDGYLYWDIIHLTTNSHRLISGEALRSITAIPEVVEILCSLTKLSQSEIYFEMGCTG